MARPNDGGERFDRLKAVRLAAIMLLKRETMNVWAVGVFQILAAAVQICGNPAINRVRFESSAASICTLREGTGSGLVAPEPAGSAVAYPMRIRTRKPAGSCPIRHGPRLLHAVFADLI